MLGLLPRSRDTRCGRTRRETVQQWVLKPCAVVQKGRSTALWGLMHEFKALLSERLVCSGLVTRGHVATDYLMGRLKKS